MMMSPKGRRVVASKQAISGLINVLASELNSPVVDKTGLTGEFDYTLEFMPEGEEACPDCHRRLHRRLVRGAHRLPGDAR